jgi:Domain of unknown function (DUF4160)
MEIMVQLTGESLTALKDSFTLGPMLNAAGTRMLVEHIVGEFDGLKIEIFSREHPPPHFRVRHNSDTANYTIKDCSKLNGGLNKFHHNIVAWHRQHKNEIVGVWNATRPTNCPVGKYVED